MFRSINRAFIRQPLHWISCCSIWLPVVAHAQWGEANDQAVVVVKGNKEPVTKKLDKTVYDTSSMPRAANGTAQDVLQSTPELSVSSDGKIAVRGNSQVTVLIDGKPTAIMSGSSDERAVALQTMSGADIASVEVLTNPSAAYNANGGAIVNIVLKRNRKPGSHAQAQGSASGHGRWNASASGDMTRSGLGVHGNVGYRQDGNLKIRESTVEWHNPFDGRTGKTRQSSEVFVHRVVESGALGIDTALGDADSLGVQARYNRRHSRPVFDMLNEVRNAADATVYHRISDGPNEQSDKSASLNYSHQTNGALFKAMAQHSDMVGLVDKSYRDVFIEPVRATGYSHAVTRPTRRLNQATLDWSRLSERYGHWGMGLDVQRKTDSLHNYQASLDPLTDVELADPTTTNGYVVTTASSAAYITNKIRDGRWEVLAGVRAERIGLQVSPRQGLSADAQWRAVNPSLHLQYAVSNKADLTLSYRRSLQMPDPRDLSPFTTYIDAQNLSRGNPGLQPQRLASWEIGSHVDASPLSGNVTAFYRSSAHAVTDARNFADNVLITSKQNGGQARSAGITVSLDWTLDPQLKLGMDGGAYRVVLHTPDLSDLVRQDGMSAYLNLRAAYSGGYETVSLDAHAQSSTITPLGRYGATNNVNLTWKHQLSKTSSLTVNLNDILDGSKRMYRTDTSTFHQTGFDHVVGQRIVIGFVKTIGRSGA